MNCSHAIVAYLPVLHRGYLELFERHHKPGVTLAILGDWFTEFEELSYFRKDIRRLDAATAATLVRGLNLFERVVVLSEPQEFIKFNPETAIVSEDHITRVLEESFPRWFLDRVIIRDTSFLMWDRMNVRASKVIVPDRWVSTEQLGSLLLPRVKAEALKSSDWWRRVGALAVRDGKVIHSAYNLHLPTEYQPYEVGDPRGSFHKGADLDMTSAIHAEKAVIAEAARRGPTLEGADMLVTTFPCPPCAKDLALAGIRRLYFLEGYAMLDAADILRAKHIEIIQVQ